MGPSIPPSPAPSADGVLQSHFTMNTVINTSHPRDAQTPDRGFQSYSQLRYSTPIQDDDFATLNQSSDYSQTSHGGSFGHYSSDRETRSFPHGDLSGGLGYGSRIPYTPEASPPTPCPTSDAIATRSGLNVSRKTVLNKTLKAKGGGVKKKTRGSKGQPSTVLEKPLSQVAKDLPNIDVADIASFVARSTEDRLKETSRNKKAGQVKRPMNAFMLYRKAYQNVAKTQCPQNNHQQVSKVCGAAWPMEPKLIREQFDEWARLERSSHQKAHPEYKFTPSKPQKAKLDDKIRSQTTPFSDGDDSDWATSHAIGRSGPRALRHASRMSEPPSIGYDHYRPLDLPSLPTSHHSLTAYPTPGRMYVQPHGHDEYAQYDITTHQHNNALGIVQNVVSRTPSPSLEYSMRHAVDLASSYSTQYDSIDGFEFDQPLTDPSLLAAPPYGFYDEGDEFGDFAHDEAIMPSNVWSGHGGAQNLAVDDSAFDESDAILRGQPDDWKYEELDGQSHFNNWVYGDESNGLV